MIWLRENVWMLAAVLGGIAVSILDSEHHSWREALADSIETILGGRNEVAGVQYASWHPRGARSEASGRSGNDGLTLVPEEVV